MRLSLAGTTLFGLALSILLAGMGALVLWLPAPLAALDWAQAHRLVAIAGAVLPGLLWLTHAVANPLLPSPIGRTGDKAALLLAGAALLPLAFLLGQEPLSRLLVVAGLASLTAAAGLHLMSLRTALPRGSVVNVARDPLTKGDDASFRHLRIASIFLLLGLVLQTLVAAAALLFPGWGIEPRWRLAIDHLLLVGFGLPTLFGVSHLMVPRLSGVPAIAAGAIKGELHSTLLGVVLLTAGFASGIKGLTVAGGLVVFFATFVWMGVLGANIMKNKSKTQRVTPGFAYIPWVFAGVLWIVVGVLLGLFLNILPQIFADRLPALRSIHVHLLLFGGALQLGLGLASRAVRPEPIPFRSHRWSFYLLNIALAVLAWGTLTGSALRLAVSAGLALLGLAAWFFPLVRRAAPVKA